jgi:UDP-N-acetylglucosamine:LPS N-acetylglucosamine transferase
MQSSTEEPGQREPRVLAVASGGGHWIQLLRLSAAAGSSDVTFVSTLKSCSQDVAGRRFFTVRDANLRDKFGLLILLVQMAWIVARVRPHVVVSTGAAPGYFAIRLSRLLGAKTIWVDSMANAERLSLCGQHVGNHADLWLTQWPHLAVEGGPKYAGSVL